MAIVLNRRTVLCWGLIEKTNQMIADGLAHWCGDQLWLKCDHCGTHHPATTAFYHADTRTPIGLATHCKFYMKSYRQRLREDARRQRVLAEETIKLRAETKKKNAEAEEKLSVRARLERDVESWIARLRPLIDAGFFDAEAEKPVAFTLRNSWEMPEPLIPFFRQRLADMREARATARRQARNPAPMAGTPAWWI